MSWEEDRRDDRAFAAEATVIRGPVESGPRGEFGGEWYVALADTALCTGIHGERLAREIARRWNATPPETK
jgi:hypothetical protein